MPDGPATEAMSQEVVDKQTGAAAQKPEEGRVTAAHLDNAVAGTSNLGEILKDLAHGDKPAKDGTAAMPAALHPTSVMPEAELAGVQGKTSDELGYPQRSLSEQTLDAMAKPPADPWIGEDPNPTTVAPSREVRSREDLIEEIDRHANPNADASDEAIAAGLKRVRETTVKESGVSSAPVVVRPEAAFEETGAMTPTGEMTATSAGGVDASSDSVSGLDGGAVVGENAFPKGVAEVPQMAVEETNIREQGLPTDLMGRIANRVAGALNWFYENNTNPQTPREFGSAIKDFQGGQRLNAVRKPKETTGTK